MRERGGIIPLASFESVRRGDRAAYTGRSWFVPPSEHTGHRMSVVGQIVDDELGPRSMYVVECSCGHLFRMARETIGKALREDAAKGVEASR